MGIISLSIVILIFISGCSITPKPMLSKDIKEEVQSSLKILNDTMKKVDKPITLDEAILRGIQHNRKNKLQIMESALSEQQLDMVYYDMLPDLTAKAGYAQRDNYAASTSTSFTNGEPDPVGANPSYSISQDKEKITKSITFSWNILDFGLSYVRAQQQSDKYLIAKEKEKKVIHNITQEIRRSYYQAVSAEDLLNKTKPMMKEIREALRNSNKIKQLKVKSPLLALQYQRELIDILRTLQTLEKSLISSKIELVGLMGLKPGTKFELAQKVQKSYAIPSINYTVKEMENIALANRPEIIQSLYRERITDKELTTAKIKWLPNLNLTAGLYNDDSQYLLNNDWFSYGASVSWNLLNVFKITKENKIAETKIAIAKEQKLALSMAVLSQVHLSYIQYQQSKKEYQLSNEYLKVAEGIFNQTNIASKLNTSSKLLLIKEKLNYLVATLRHSASYANLQNSYGSVFVSMGIDTESSMKEVVKKTVPKVVPIIEEKNILKVKKELNSTVKKSKQFSSDFFGKNFSKATILLRKGDVLDLKGTKYSVQTGDSIAELSKIYNMRIKVILMNNFWLAEQDRVSFKK